MTKTGGRKSRETLPLKGYIFHFCTYVLGKKNVLTPRGMIPHGVSFFATKIRITQRKLNQIEHILTHWSVAQAGSNCEKIGGQKSRWTVP